MLWTLFVVFKEIRRHVTSFCEYKRPQAHAALITRHGSNTIIQNTCVHRAV